MCKELVHSFICYSSSRFLLVESSLYQILVLDFSHHGWCACQVFFFSMCFIEGLAEVIIILPWLYWISILQYEPFCKPSYYTPASNFFNWLKLAEIDLFSLQRTFRTQMTFSAFSLKKKKMIVLADQWSLISLLKIKTNKDVLFRKVCVYNKWYDRYIWIT